MTQVLIKTNADFNSKLKGMDTKDNVDYVSTWLRDNLPLVTKDKHTWYGTICCYNNDLGCTNFKATCHKQFSSEAGTSTTFVGTLFTNNMWPECNREYLEYILSETESPWKDIFDDMVVIRDSEDDYPYGFVFFSVNDKDIKLLTSFLIVSRMSGSWKQSPFFRYFNNISGFTKAESIFLSSYFVSSTQGYKEMKYAYEHMKPHGLQKDNTHISLQGQCTGDQPFNDVTDILRLENSKPNMKDSKGTLKQGSRPNPCNRIWGRAGDYLVSNMDYYGIPAKVSGKYVIECIKADKPLDASVMDLMKQGLYGDKMVYFGDYNG